MIIVNPMFHMDADFNWRWYIISDRGDPICISTQSFFNYDDARRDFDDFQRRLIKLAA